MKNNAKYINVDALLALLPDDLPYKASVKRVFMQAPSADVVPREEAVAQVLTELENIAISKLNAGLSVANLDDTYYIQAIDDLKEKYSTAPPANLMSLDDVSRAIKDYCCDLIDAGKDMVEVTEFNADLQKKLKSYIGEKANGTS